jgi:hypothetical protein
MQPFWYLATSYTKHPDGVEAAYEMALHAAAMLTVADILAYSPIVYMHPIAKLLPDKDHAFWLQMDRPLMDAACGLIVLKDGNWEASEGIAHEIKVFTAAGKPILFMDPGIIPGELIAGHV